MKPVPHSQILMLLLALMVMSGACKPVYHLFHVDPMKEEIARQEPDAEVDRYLVPYRDSLQEKMNAILGQAGMELEKRKPESTLGNTMADLLLDEVRGTFSGAEVDFAVLNYGGLRIPSLSAGPITLGKIYEVMPFENLVVVLDIPGSEMPRVLAKLDESGGWPVSRGFSYQLGNVSSLRINGLPLDGGRVYRVAMSDFLANGGDDCFFFKTMKRQTSQLLVRDALINRIRALQAQGKAIGSPLEGRIRK